LKNEAVGLRILALGYSSKSRP